MSRKKHAPGGDPGVDVGHAEVGALPPPYQGAYVTMWEHARRDEPPASFAVEGFQLATVCGS